MTPSVRFHDFCIFSPSCGFLIEGHLRTLRRHRTPRNHENGPTLDGCGAGVSPAVARASCPCAGAGRSRDRGRDARATIFKEERTFWVRFAQNTLKIEFVFSSFSVCLSLFSMTYWVRSCDFALFRSSCLPGSVVKSRGREVERSRSRGVANSLPAGGLRAGGAVSSRFSIPGLLNSSTP